MKLPTNARIATEKLTEYLLVARRRNDKSKWLARAGFNRENWPLLAAAIRLQLLPLDAILLETTNYGSLYEIKGDLTGPNGKSLAVVSIRMTERQAGVTKFITMYPDKGA